MNGRRIAAKHLQLQHFGAHTAGPLCQALHHFRGNAPVPMALRTLTARLKRCAMRGRRDTRATLPVATSRAPSKAPSSQESALCPCAAGRPARPPGQTAGPRGQGEVCVSPPAALAKASISSASSGPSGRKTIWFTKAASLLCAQFRAAMDSSIFCSLATAAACVSRIFCTTAAGALLTKPLVRQLGGRRSQLFSQFAFSFARRASLFLPVDELHHGMKARASFVTTCTTPWVCPRTAP